MTLPLATGAAHQEFSTQNASTALVYIFSFLFAFGLEQKARAPLLLVTASLQCKPRDMWGHGALPAAMCGEPGTEVGLGLGVQPA